MRALLKSLLLSGLIVFLLSGCTAPEEDPVPSPYGAVNLLDGVTLTVLEDTLTPAGLTLVFHNETDEEYTYGEAYTLERKMDGEWYVYPIETEEDYGFIDIGYLLSPQTRSEQVIDWEWLYGRLETGEYRILKELLDVYEAGNYEKRPLAAEFTIQ